MRMEANDPVQESVRRLNRALLLAARAGASPRDLQLASDLARSATEAAPTRADRWDVPAAVSAWSGREKDFERLFRKKPSKNRLFFSYLADN